MRGHALGPFIVLVLAASGCTVLATLDDHEAHSDVVVVDGGGPDAGDAGVILPPGCDPLLDPKDAPCQVANELGVFVSPVGDDTHAGTKLEPLRTIGAGIKRVLSRQADTGVQLVGVFVCEGPYNEAIALKGAGQGVSVFGGFACADWHHIDTPTTVSPPAKGYVLRVEGIAPLTRFQDLVMTAAPAELPGESSVAAFVSDSSVELKRVVLNAGDGMPGANGAPFSGAGNTFVGSSMGFGAVASPLAGAAAHTCACPIFGSSNGGFGGKGSGVSGGGGGVAQNPADPISDTGVEAPASCSVQAQRGSVGQARPQGPPSPYYGALTANGWEPEVGVDGSVGGAAQGGGGGSGGAVGAGGGGGCGGCGGAGGKGGRGGGSSIGVLLLKSTASFVYCRINLGKGGFGGAGGNGQDGLTGGSGGAPAGTGGCGGAAGGTGAGGNGGDGGTGGISVGIVRRGGTAPRWVKDMDLAVPNDAPDLDDVVLGSGGKGGDPGARGGAFNGFNFGHTGNAGRTGITGVARASLTDDRP